MNAFQSSRKRLSLLTQLGLLTLGLANLPGCGDGRDKQGVGGIGEDTASEGSESEGSGSGGGNGGGEGSLPGDGPSVLPGPGGGGGGGGKGPEEGAPEEQCDKIDFVFVIDDSRSMTMDQLGLITNFPKFIEVLNAYRNKDGDPLDYRIAVTTSSISYEVTSEGETFTGDDALFRTTNASKDGRSCWSDDRRWMERGDADLEERFSCAAEVGANGLGHEMQMLALNMSLQDRVKSGEHEGFLRDDALLAAVLLTDEDDCSKEDKKIDSFDTCSSGPGSFPDTLIKQKEVLKRLDSVKGNTRARWALGVLSKYICLPDLNGGWIPVEGPKKRLKGLVEEAGDNAVYVQICDDKYAQHLNTILDTFTEACENFPPPV